ncbi:hypothetical protein EVAR_58861_1 [Eumeta japonica]|uniref:HTH psq-type domain-containing protein n=1 Tax=Eumeta variegata TaxID=151549 RepID=A0A4C1YA25_EUMVA|nr:hypothetical protein EVAR_58861_1 [Eumeta japonica]
MAKTIKKCQKNSSKKNKVKSTNLNDNDSKAPKKGIVLVNTCKKVSKKKRPVRINYSPGDLANALKAIDTGLSLRKAAAAYNVPIATLSRKKGNPETSKQKTGPPPVFQKPQNLTHSRAAVTDDDLKDWFEEQGKYLQEKQLTKIPPKRIFNCDETYVSLCPPSEKVLLDKGSRSAYKVVDSEKEEPQINLTLSESVVSKENDSKSANEIETNVGNPFDQAFKMPTKYLPKKRESRLWDFHQTAVGRRPPQGRPVALSLAKKVNVRRPEQCMRRTSGGVVEGHFVIFCSIKRLAPEVTFRRRRKRLSGSFLRGLRRGKGERELLARAANDSRADGAALSRARLIGKQSSF